MGNTFKENTKRTFKMSKISLREIERRDKYISQNRFFVSDLLNENPRIAYAFHEYQRECGMY